MILRQDKSVWGAGANNFGQLGFGSATKFDTNFVEVLAGAARAVAAGSAHSMVLKQDGSVWATGRNQYGQLGDGTGKDREHFVKVISIGAKAVIAGSRHSLVVMDDGRVLGATSTS